MPPIPWMPVVKASVVVVTIGILRGGITFDFIPDEIWLSSEHPFPVVNAFLRRRYLRRWLGLLVDDRFQLTRERKRAKTWRWTLWVLVVRVCNRALMRGVWRIPRIAPRQASRWTAGTLVTQAARQLDARAALAEALRFQEVVSIVAFVVLESCIRVEEVKIHDGLLQQRLRLEDKLCKGEEKRVLAGLLWQEKLREAEVFQQQQLCTRRAWQQERYLLFQQGQRAQQLSLGRQQQQQQHQQQGQQGQQGQQQGQASAGEIVPEYLSRGARSSRRAIEEDDGRVDDEQMLDELRRGVEDVTFDLRQAEHGTAYLQHDVRELLYKVDSLENEKLTAEENAIRTSRRFSEQLSGMGAEICSLRRTVDRLMLQNNTLAVGGRRRDGDDADQRPCIESSIVISATMLEIRMVYLHNLRSNVLRGFNGSFLFEDPSPIGQIISVWGEVHTEASAREGCVPVVLPGAGATTEEGAGPRQANDTLAVGGRRQDGGDVGQRPWVESNMVISATMCEIPPPSLETLQWANMVHSLDIFLTFEAHFPFGEIIRTCGYSDGPRSGVWVLFWGEPAKQAYALDRLAPMAWPAAGPIALEAAPPQVDAFEIITVVREQRSVMSRARTTADINGGLQEDVAPPTIAGGRPHASTVARGTLEVAAGTAVATAPPVATASGGRELFVLSRSRAMVELQRVLRGKDVSPTITGERTGTSTVARGTPEVTAAAAATPPVATASFGRQPFISPWSRVVAGLRGVLHDDDASPTITGGRTCRSATLRTADVDAVSREVPSATANDTTDGEEKHDKLMLPKDLDIFGESKRAEPGGEDDGATIIAPEVAVGPVRLSSSKPAVYTNVARAAVDAVSLEAPSATVKDKSDGEEKDDRLTPRKGLDAMEEDKRTEPGGEEGGAAATTLMGAMGPVGLGLSQPAVDTRVAMTTVCIAEVDAVSRAAPSATAADTSDDEEKDDRLTRPKDSDAMEESERTDPGGEEDGVAVIVPEVVMRSLGLRMADVVAASLGLPSATVDDTSDGEKKDDRLTRSRDLDAMEEDRRTEPGGEEDGATATRPEAAVGSAGLRSSNPAVDTNNARASESVFTEAATFKPDASQVESSEEVKGIRKRSQSAVLISVMNKVMEEWCSLQISDALHYVKTYSSSGVVLDPAEPAADGQDGQTDASPDGAEAGECDEEDEIKRSLELEELAMIFGRLNQDDRRNFMIWFNHVRKAVNEGAEALKLREAALANMKGEGTRRKKGWRKGGRRNRREKKAEGYEVSKEETSGGKEDNAAGFCFCPERGEMLKGTMPFKFGAGTSSGAATIAAFVFGHKDAEPTRTDFFSSPSEGTLQNHKKTHGGQPLKTASAMSRASFEAVETHPPSLINTSTSQSISSVVEKAFKSNNPPSPT